MLQPWEKPDRNDILPVEPVNDFILSTLSLYNFAHPLDLPDIIFPPQSRSFELVSRFTLSERSTSFEPVSDWNLPSSSPLFSLSYFSFSLLKRSMIFRSSSISRLLSHSCFCFKPLCISFHPSSLFVSPALIGKYLVTFGEYDVFCADTNRPLPNDQGWGRGTFFFTPSHMRDSHFWKYSLFYFTFPHLSV